MRIAVTGASGLVGWPVARHLGAAGHEITTYGGAPVPPFAHVPWRLGERPDFSGQDAVVHSAFAHLDGRYRGGEGDDPEGFRGSNLGGTLKVLEAAHAARARVIFLSSRAVYGDYPPGTTLDETRTPRPDTLYGEVKLAAEQALAEGDTALRITGVYGPHVPGRAHKWDDLFAAFGAGEPVAPRIATEVHADDVGQAVATVLRSDAAPRLLNVSDIVLDRRDLLRRYVEATGREGRLPDRGDPAGLNVMATDRLRALGWRPRGLAGVGEVIADWPR